MGIIRNAFTALLALLLTACAVTPAAVYKAADSDAKKAYATIEMARIVTEQAVAVATDPTTAPEIKAALKAANRTARPTIDELAKVYAEYKAAKAAFDAAQPGASGQLLVVAANLRGWVSAAQGHIDAIKKIIGGAK